MATIDPGDLRRLLAGIYEAKGTPGAVAATVAGLQVEANLAGHDSHGAILTTDYVARIDQGHIAPDAPIEVVAESPVTAVIDGHWGFGFAVTTRATELLIEKAGRDGLAAITIRRQSHVGRLGAYTSRVAARGMIGLMTADSGAGPKAAAPFGGRERRLGTNPLSIALPAESSIVCLDMATTTVAAGKLNLAIHRGEPIPDGWIVDREGRPTRRAEDYYEGGALLPLGGDQGHKGYGLSFVVEALSGLLTGLGFGLDPSGRHNDGCFLAAFDVARFRPLAQFKRDMEDFIRFLKATEPAAGFKEVLYPGEVEARARRERERSGIEVDDASWQRITDIARSLGVTVPVPRAPPGDR